MQHLVRSGFGVGSETSAARQVPLVAWLPGLTRKQDSSLRHRAIPSQCWEAPMLGLFGLLEGRAGDTHPGAEGPGGGGRGTAVPHRPTQSHAVHPVVPMSVLTNSQWQQEVSRLEASGRGSGASPFAL